MRGYRAGLVAFLLASAACNSSSSSRGDEDGQQPEEPELKSFPVAERVLGQPDFTSAAPDRGGAISGAGVHLPVGSAGYADGTLVLPDTYNHRLLEYSGIPTADGASATAIRGQEDAGAGLPSHAVGRYHYPQAVAFGDGERIVADTAASRVQLGTGAGAAVLGWGASAAYGPSCAADRVAEPTRAIQAAGRLIVADRANHRVLIWKTVPAAGAPADLVLGQRDFTHCAPNDILGKGTSGGRSAATLSYPTDVWSDGQRLVVVDQGNHRVLLWNEFPTTSGARADVVLGQADFRTAVADTTRASLRWPAAVTSDGKALFVADARNHRVLRWKAFPTAHGAPADQVLGQSDFVHGAPNDDDQDGQAGAPTARTLQHPTGVALAGDFLIVTDTYNNRFLLFRWR